MDEQPVPFVDAHVHLWDHAVPDLEWSWTRLPFTPPGEGSRPVDVDRPRYAAEELAAEVEGLGVEGIVHIQSAAVPMPDPSVETAWLQEMGERTGIPEVIVGSCSLQAADAPEVLRRHARYDRFRGIRDLTIEGLPDLDALTPGMDVAEELGLSVELLRLPVEQFQVLRDIADRWPGVTLVLGHAGLPRDRSDASRRAWRDAAGLLAGAPNAVVKISGVAGRANPQWSLDNMRPWVEGCIDAFGVERAMFGSNWPFDAPVATYRQLVEAYRELVGGLSGTEQHAVLHGTARRVYRFPVP